MPILYFVFFVVATALVFDFFNGFHDAANSVATVVIWGEKIVVAWVVTFPGAALIGAAGYAFAHFVIQPFIH